MKTLRNFLRYWWLCRTKRCSYFNHYLAYGPADLTHEGFHAAERKCEEWQKRFTDWLDANPEGEVPAELDRQAAIWERRVRA